jgi:hypothetical protein
MLDRIKLLKSYTQKEYFMPRIKDDILDCVVYLYESVDEAKAGKNIGGSGFIISVPISIPQLNRSANFRYIVTNRHVIQEGAFVVRLSGTDGSTYIVESEYPHWHFHPNNHDIAIAQIFHSDREQIRDGGPFRTVGISQFVTPEIMNKYDIGIGDDVFMVGRFINHEGRQKNMPALQFGHLSIMPLEPIISKDGTAQESFAVDIRSSGGVSGSPVFVRIENFDLGRNLSGIDNDFSLAGPKGLRLSYRVYLLGVDWGHLNSKYRVKKEASDDLTDLYIQANTNMAAVVPAWRLAELIQITQKKTEDLSGNDLLWFAIDISKAEIIPNSPNEALIPDDFSE